MTLSLRWIVPLLLLLPTASADPDGNGCKRCDKRGVVICPAHKADIHDFEKDVLFCSVVAACKSCAGALLVDCKRCKGGPDDHLIAERQAVVAKWMDGLVLDKFMGRALPAIETERFQLTMDTGPVRIKKKRKMSAHELMHVVTRDVLEVQRQIASHYQLVAPEDGDKPRTELEAALRRNYSNKMRIWFWSNLDDHQRVMREYMGSGSTGDFKLLGGRPLFSAWTEKNMKTVPGVRSVCTHTAAHMLLSNLFKPLWIGDIGGGWFDAGSGHWYEYEVLKRTVSYCIEEATVPLEYHGGQWRRAIRKRVTKQEKLFLPSLLPQNTGAMTLPEQALCWSFYDWLVANHTQALPKILKGLKSKRPSRDVLKETLGLTLLQAEDAWRAWVLETYPMKGDEPRKAGGKKK